MNQYLIIPEDIQESWVRAIMTAKFHQQLQENSGCFVGIRLMVKGGEITAVCDPTFTRMEPHQMHREAGRFTWWSVVRRLISVAGECREGMIEMRVLIGQNGEPVMWERPSVGEWRKVG